MAPMRDEDSSDRDLARSSAPGRRPTWAPDRLLHAEEVAEHLGMTAQWVYEQSRKGRVPHLKLGRYYRYQAASIDEWLEELERGGRGTDAADRARAAPPRRDERRHRASRTRGPRRAHPVG